MRKNSTLRVPCRSERGTSSCGNSVGSVVAPPPADSRKRREDTDGNPERSTHVDRRRRILAGQLSPAAVRSTTGDDYEYYQPGYRYGYKAANRYQGREWDDIEPDLSRDWDRYEYRGESTWERVKDAVRDAWDRVTGKRTIGTQSLGTHALHTTEGAARASSVVYSPTGRTAELDYSTQRLDRVHRRRPPRGDIAGQQRND